MGASQQMLLGGGPASSFGLDDYTSGLWSLVSLDRLISAYSGPCIRIRRASDNAELDIDFASDVVDSADAVAHAGGGDAFLVKAYDQTGNGNHIGQATPGAQPRVVASGVWDATLARLDASDDFLVSETTSGGANLAFTALVKGTLRSTAALYMMLEHTADTNANDGADWYSNSGNTGWALARNSSADIVGGSIPGNNFDGAVSALRCDVSEATAANRAKIYKAGAFQGNSGTVVNSPSGAFADAAYFVGSRGGVNFFAPFNLDALAIYQGAAGLSDADIAAISAIL